MGPRTPIYRFSRLFLCFIWAIWRITGRRAAWLGRDEALLSSCDRKAAANQLQRLRRGRHSWSQSWRSSAPLCHCGASTLSVAYCRNSSDDNARKPREKVVRWRKAVTASAAYDCVGFSAITELQSIICVKLSLTGSLERVARDGSRNINRMSLWDLRAMFIEEVTVVCLAAWSGFMLPAPMIV